MSLELRQQLKLSQQLVMTPQLQQAIKLLQMSRLDLVEAVHQELLENPFLEEAAEQPTQDEKRQADGADDRSKGKDEDQVYDGESSRNADWEDYLGDFASSPRDYQQRELQEEEDLPAETRYAEKPTLAGHLLWQLHLSSLEPDEVTAGECIIGNLSSSGYLQATCGEVAEMAHVSAETVERVLARIQLFDPVGVAARTPEECLLVQIKEKGLEGDPVLVEMV
ncbi:MAG: RNA polymerase sigma-54 factor, partial [Desulfovibrio sp.]|nr:RNA polymerase sigma-54 factor [Desulfovibrio sp.]